ncbi:MAG: glycosyltransferase [Verrucomicrobiota bacterium]|nr:glycosyltransferase [Verrucomicrobiota bacterium]
MRLAYLYSRYPVLSQTFCDTEMLELERRGFPLIIGAVHSPLTSIRHGHTRQLRAPVHYAPPQPILRVWEEQAKHNGTWPAALVDEHDRKYGPSVKASTRARNALYFADLFAHHGIDRFHVHFANRAAHTAIFVKAISGIPFSVTAHGQDFMADLGNDALLREICSAAELIAVETDYSRGLLAKQCPESASKIFRVYNGMELANFPAPVAGAVAAKPLRMLSIGRLVPFKGFAYLIDACAELKARGLAFECEIAGDGPLRGTLETQIADRGLTDLVKLTGALSQEEVRARLRASDVFVLASIVDDAGTSDVFPTVILEAMASAKPVISTAVAGIPESVVDGQTGFLAPPRDSGSFAAAIEKLARVPADRIEFGAAGRRRIEECFQIATTVEPLLDRLQKIPSAARSRPIAGTEPGVAYLLDRWPDPRAPEMEAELAILANLRVPVTVFVSEYNASVRLTPALKKLATKFAFLPDELVIEAEWQTNRTAARKLEDDRANATHRAPAASFLRAARYAVVLRRLLADHGVTHVHATSSDALLCATYLHAMTGVTISATIESHPLLPRELIEEALARCVGGRIPHQKYLTPRGRPFFLDPLRSSAFSTKLRQLMGIDLTGRSPMWQEWANLLLGWSSSAPANRNE